MVCLCAVHCFCLLHNNNYCDEYEDFMLPFDFAGESNVHRVPCLIHVFCKTIFPKRQIFDV